MKSARKIAASFLLKKRSLRVPQRVLGRTGLRVRALGLGGQALLEIEGQQKAAKDLINKAIDLGVNYFDTAAIYGPSREYLGKTLKNRRSEIVLASKVRNRDYKGAKKELDESFKLLQTDYIDILQIHGIHDESDKKVLGKDGALRVLIEAREANKIGFIGISGHYDPKIHMEFMDEFDFDTALMAINPAIPEFDKAVRKAWSRNMGVIAMKVMARGILPMYYPYEILVHYAMRRSDVTIIGCSTETDLEKNIIAASEYEGQDVYINVPEHLKPRFAYFFKGYEKKKWPSTYQPDLPEINYE